MDEQTWLAAIRAAPRDDAVRLAFADWLEAQGDADRGDLIRVQIALARPRRLDGGERRRLRQRESELRKTTLQRWRARLPQLPGVIWCDIWERGLVSQVSLASVAVLRDHAEAIFQATVIRGMSLAGVGAAQAAELLDRPEIAQLCGLHLNLGGSGYGQGDEVARVAAQSPHLAHLRWFGISGSAVVRGSLSDEGAGLLAASPYLGNLRHLFLGDNSIGDAGLAALAASPHLGRLLSLDLLQNAVGDDGLVQLARSSTLASLCDIQLYGNRRHTDRAVRALVRGTLAGQFRSLGLGGGHVTEAGARAVARSAALSRLRCLDLNSNEIGDAGLIEIANSPYLPRLRELYLRNTGLTDASVAVLARSRLVQRLRYLNLEYNPIRDVGTWELVRSPGLEGLDRLLLGDCDDLQPPVCLALKQRLGERVVVHIDLEEDEEELIGQGVHSSGPTTGDALLDDIRRHPDDAAPRLVYADWIEENGEPERAEFIRTQCALARMEADDPDRAALTAREKDLLARHGWDWTDGAFLRWLQHPPLRCSLDQPHEVCEIFADAMRLRQEEYHSDKIDDPAREARWQKLENRLEAQEFAGEKVRLQLFAAWSFERGFLEWVDVDEVMFLIFAPAVRDLGPGVRRLEIDLDDDDLRVGDRIIRHLIATMERPRLQTLDLGTQLDEMTPLRALAAWRGLEQLTKFTGLRVWGEDLEADEVVQTLARSRHLRQLETLELYAGEYTDAAIDAVLASPYLRNLKRLHLPASDPDLSDEALERFQARFGDAPPSE
jgi:uncharacterized protein (TIGR02996 family)